MIKNETLLVELSDKYCIPVRVLNILLSQDVRTVGQLLDFIPNHQMRNMGRKSLCLILELQDELRQELGQEKTDNGIDWGEVRTKAAITFEAAMIGSNKWVIPREAEKEEAPECYARAAISYADALIAELKKGGNQ